MRKFPTRAADLSHAVQNATRFAPVPESGEATSAGWDAKLIEMDERARRRGLRMPDKCVVVPIHDERSEDHDPLFVLCLYGVTKADVLTISPDGPQLWAVAVRRLGLDPHRYRPLIWEIR